MGDPPIEKRRYDTWFFVATLPAGAEVRGVSSEADQSGWVTVEEVLRSHEAGEKHICRPRRQCCGLAAAGTGGQSHSANF
jgi:hypothetical protein